MKGSTVSPGSYKRQHNGCGASQERLRNGWCDVAKGKGAAWGEGRLMKMDAAGPQSITALGEEGAIIED